MPLGIRYYANDRCCDPIAQHDNTQQNMCNKQTTNTPTNYTNHTSPLTTPVCSDRNIGTPHQPTATMCQSPQLPIEPQSRSVPVVPLWSPLLLSLGLLSVAVSFLSGCAVRLLCHRPAMPTSKNDTASWKDVTTARIDEITAYAQHVQIELLLPRRVVDETTWTEILRVVGRNATHRCIAASVTRVSCFGISSGGRVVLHVVPRDRDSCIVVVDWVFPRQNRRDRVDGLTPSQQQQQQHHQQQQQRLDSLLQTVAASFPDVRLKWSHRLRGFRESSAYLRHANPLDHEMGADVLRRMDDKRLLLYEKTTFQHVHVYELPWRGRSRFDEGEGHRTASFPRTQRQQQQQPSGETPPRYDRALYLDGVLQSSLRGDAAYHEGLVHPGMLAHVHPRRVGIIGGGEGATLREVLKHKTVERVVMLEIDERLMGVARKVLKEWNDCSDFGTEEEEGGALRKEDQEREGYKSCFEDDRVEVHFVDAFQWFMDRYYDAGEEESDDGRRTTSNATTATVTAIATSERELFDVIIMDALDPDDFVDFADKLYNNTPFLQSLYNSLSPEGVFAVQLGASPDLVDPADENGPFRNRATMISRLEYVGFQSIHMYEEGHCDFYHPWSVLVAFKAYATRARWYRNAAEIELELRRRIRRTQSGRPALVHFDAAKMYGYQMPSKAFESVYCRQENEPEECEEYNGFWTEAVDVPVAEMRVRKSGVWEAAGRGVFAGKDVPTGATIALEDGTRAFYVAPSTWKVLDGVYEWSDENGHFRGIEDELSAMKYFIEGYGYACQFMGETHHTIDSGLMTFANHGCNSSYNYGDEFHPLTEGTMDLSSEEIPRDHDCTAKPYSPIQERHLRQILSSGDVALREIKAGEEILVNYVMFANPDEWTEDVKRLRDQCAGSAVGEVSSYELGF